MKIRPLKVKKPFASASNRASHTAASAPLTDITPQMAGYVYRRHKRYELSDLSLRSEDHIKTWKTSFVPSLLVWAGTYEDPFKVNSELYAMVTNIWERTFPAIALHDDKLLALVKVVSRMD